MSQREFLLTGVTGFLGKVVLEELIRREDELSLERVHLIIRPRKGRSPDERFAQEVAGSPCFSRPPAGWTDRVAVVEGTLEKPCLGLSPEARDYLGSRVTHVLHAAASVSFDLPLEEAARSNVGPTVHLLELARRCQRLERLVYVSTAYVTPHPGDGAAIAESLAPLPCPAEALYQSILDGSANQQKLLHESRHPNTYTFTKCLAEHLITERRGGVPLSIVRPSIISASWRYPFPGWIDSMAGFGGFVVLIGLGHLRVVAAVPQTRLNLVPVDLVADRMLDECLDPRSNGSPVIRHAVASLAQSPRLLECWDQIRRFYSIHRIDRRPVIRYVGPRGIRFHLADLLHHRLAVKLAGVRSAALRRSGAQLLSRLTYLNAAFPYFTSNSFDFATSRPGESFEPGDYVTTVCRGIYRHILGKDESEWTMAGKKHRGFGESDFHWAFTQSEGNLWIRSAAWLTTKVLRRSVDRVTVDIPSFEAARTAAPPDEPIVLVPNHRSYLDFVLCSYLCFARPDLRIGIPYIAAAIEFGRIPVLGRILTWLHAFYVRRGAGPDPELTRRVHDLVGQGKTLEFFVEGQRSRSREFLVPKRGLLRLLQATGRTFTLLPVAFSYDRVPEEQTFARELAGEPKPKMRLTGLARWAWRAWRRKIHLGRIHIACGTPIRMTPTSKVQEVAQEVIRRLEGATVATTYHLEAFLARYALDGYDPLTLRHEIELRGGRVLESPLRGDTGLDSRIAHTFRYQFQHHFRTGREDVPFEEILSNVREREPSRLDV
jgi:nucleoside-diphosphate-sugar epimerase/1-acyl-sn-glycerol-3-phosphate acyltransferase